MNLAVFGVSMQPTGSGFLATSPCWREVALRRPGSPIHQSL